MYRYSLFRLILSLWVVSTGATVFCYSRREFPVNNCTDCSAFNPITNSSGSVDITSTVCKERKTGRAGGMAYTCKCVDFPAVALVRDLYFYPQKEDNVTRCESTLSTVPHVIWVCRFLVIVVMLYVGAHLFYIVWLSGICCCARCTKVDGAALSFFVSTLSWLIIPVWRLVTKGTWIVAQGLSAATVGAVCFLSIAQALFYPSISDVAYPEENMANRRCCINVSFWSLSVATMLLTVIAAVFPLIEEVAWFGEIAKHLGFLCIGVQLVYCNIFTAIAHKKMREVSLRHHHHTATITTTSSNSTATITSSKSTADTTTITISPYHPRHRHQHLHCIALECGRTFASILARTSPPFPPRAAARRSCAHTGQQE